MGSSLAKSMLQTMRFRLQGLQSRPPLGLQMVDNFPLQARGLSFERG